jgi:hypothetical protein
MSRKWTINRRVCSFRTPDPPTGRARRLCGALAAVSMLLVHAGGVSAQSGADRHPHETQVGFYMIEDGGVGTLRDVAVTALERSTAVSDAGIRLSVDWGSDPETFYLRAQSARFSTVLIASIIDDQDRSYFVLRAYVDLDHGPPPSDPSSVAWYPVEDAIRDLNGFGDFVASKLFPDWIGFGSLEVVSGPPRTEPFDSWSLYGVSLSLEDARLPSPPVVAGSVEVVVDGVALDPIGSAFALVPSGVRRVEVFLDGSGGGGRPAFSDSVVVRASGATEVPVRPHLLTAQEEARLGSYVEANLPNATYAMIGSLASTRTALEVLRPRLEFILILARADDAAMRLQTLWKTPLDVDPAEIGAARLALERQVTLSEAAEVPVAADQMLDRLTLLAEAHPQLVSLALLREITGETDPERWPEFLHAYEKQVAAASPGEVPPGWLVGDLDAMREFLAEYDRTRRASPSGDRTLVRIGTVALGVGAMLWGGGVLTAYEARDLYRDYRAGRDPNALSDLEERVERVDTRSTLLQGGGIAIAAAGAGSLLSAALIRHRGTSHPARLLDTRMRAYFEDRMELDRSLHKKYPDNDGLPARELPLW